jgi:hypothetical protein
MPANRVALSQLLARFHQTDKALGFTAGEPWADLIRRISTPGVAAEVSDETYDHFLDVLPPKWMGHGFAFAEGEEPLRLFWKGGGKFYCLQFTWEETVSFCAAAGIPTPH